MPVPILLDKTVAAHHRSNSPRSESSFCVARLQASGRGSVGFDRQVKGKATTVPGFACLDIHKCWSFERLKVQTLFGAYRTRTGKRSGPVVQPGDDAFPGRKMSRSRDAAVGRLLNVVRALSGWLEIYPVRWRSSSCARWLVASRAEPGEDRSASAPGLTASTGSTRDGTGLSALASARAMSRLWPGSGSSQTAKIVALLQADLLVLGGQERSRGGFSRRSRTSWCQPAIVSGWTYRIP